MALLAHGAMTILFTGPHSRSLPYTECYKKPQECTVTFLLQQPSGEQPQCFLGGSSSEQYDQSNEILISIPVFDIDQAIFCLERLKKKTVTAHNITQDTLKASCRHAHCEPVVRNLAEGRKTVFPVPNSMTVVPGKPLSDPADLFSAAEDAQVAMSSDASHCQHVNLGSGVIIAEQPEAPTDAPPPSPFANPDTFVVSPMNPDTSLSKEGEIREVPAAEESV
ncbi:hypothetical protein L218DRAFT_948657 [Marasmius fiardii PR-910]|nr:hypothetical protein L218DRAFT_948657 [Marasmius fiardii PR-910]